MVKKAVELSKTHGWFLTSQVILGYALRCFLSTIRFSFAIQQTWRITLRLQRAKFFSTLLAVRWTGLFPALAPAARLWASARCCAWLGPLSRQKKTVFFFWQMIDFALCL